MTFPNSRRLVFLSLVAVLAVGGMIVTRSYLRERRQWELARAAYDGDLPTVRRCVEEGVDINTFPTAEGGSLVGVPALTSAADSGRLEVVRYLLDHGANPNVVGEGNPLIMAIWKQHDAVARLLLERGADPNAHGEGTPLFAAEGSGQTELAALLRQLGAH